MKLYQFISIASEILPKEFDGKAKNLQNFIDCIDLLKKMIVKDYEQIAVLLVKSRLTNYVRNWIGSENSLDQIIETIKSLMSLKRLLMNHLNLFEICSNMQNKMVKQLKNTVMK